MAKIALKIKNWIKANPWEFVILVAILLFGAFLRLYKIDQYLTFLGDEGRDAIIVRRLLVYGDPILIGPGTSIGNMYLGPLYYYLMAPALFLANYSPVGPAVQIALLGVVTIFFVYLIAKDWFGWKAAIIASVLYAIAPTVIIYSRSSWNPNIMPFFALLSIFSIWKVWKEASYNWLIVLGISLAFCLQSHYLGLLLFPTIGLFWLLTFLRERKEKNTKPLIKKTVIGVVIFLFLMSPLVIFDARHGWNNFGAMKKFFTVRQETVSIKPWKAIPNSLPISEKIMMRLVGANQANTGPYILWVIVTLSVWFLVLKRKDLPLKTRQGFYLLLVWLGFAVLGLGLYKQEIYDHYYGFFFPAPFLLIGGLGQFLLDNKKRTVSTLAMIALVVLLYLNLKVNPLLKAPNQQLRRAKEVAQKIREEAKGERFNLAVLAERNYEDGYQYFLERWGEKVVEIDAQKADETITNQLFVVCELPKEKCDPTHSPKAEVANFGWSKIENEWEVFGARLYKLVHTSQ